jgi:hypothetical protein
MNAKTELLKFTFSEPCNVIDIREKNQQDAYIFLINLLQLNYPLHVSMAR